MADSLVPLMFMKEFKGLEPAIPPVEEVSFARFIITSYLFCGQQIPDLIHDFLSLLRQKLTVSIHANLHTYSLDQMLAVMVEDVTPCAATAVLRDSLACLDKDGELSVLTVVILGIKFPVLFYTLERFRKHIRRIVFGDKFWHADRPALKLRIAEELEAAGNSSGGGGAAWEGLLEELPLAYQDEQTARRLSSQRIIADAWAMRRTKRFRLREKAATALQTVDDACLRVLKDAFGYERSRRLVVDSGIPLHEDCDSSFVQRAFGASSPVPLPARGINVFPNAEPRGILDLPEDEDDDEEEEGEAGGDENDDVENGEGGNNGQGDDGDENGEEGKDGDYHHKENGDGLTRMSVVAETFAAAMGTSFFVRQQQQQPSHRTGSVIGSLRGSVMGSVVGSVMGFGGSVSGLSSIGSPSERGEGSPSNSPSPSNGRLSPLPFPFKSLSLSLRGGVDATTTTTLAADALPPDTALPAVPQLQSLCETVLDSRMGREFRFDPETGKAAWVRCVVDEAGDLLLQSCS